MQVELPDIRIVKASVSTGEEPPHETLPEGIVSTNYRAVVSHCKVEGVIGSEINFELLLPDDWNGKFLMGGGGGFVGSLGYQGRFSVNRGYATVATDTGHSSPGIRAEWAYHQPERRINYGYLGVHRTAEAAKVLLRAYYNSQPNYSYFVGCSNGGHQALMEAQRFPLDFDGIVSGAPANDFTGVMAAGAYNLQRIFPDPKDLANPVITLENQQLLQSTILEKCDKLDGIQDGVLDDPRECSFKVSDLPVCPGGKSGTHCVTVAQREAIRSIYEGPRNSQGRIFFGMPFGGEAEERAWQNWITGPNRSLMDEYGEPSAWFGFATQGFKYLMMGDPDWNYVNYDFESFEKDSAHLASWLDATSTDLSGLKNADSKLILWHGWSDAALTALGSIDYFEQVEQRDPQVRNYFCFFLMPGVFHCASGPGPDRVDWVDAIEQWVEHGKAPGPLTASKVREGRIAAQRPLCIYPERAVYQGGDPNKVSSFVCSAP